ncbi:Vps16, N-terminal region-domain-containing protein [Ochromonadaceae sp. CCMP2298]|nr:Vps16, N-terminal region-domain-containing protein [Ochromonadaceae sp. CCMP2298]
MLADSHPLGNILYRKWPMYEMLWGDEKHLEDYVIRGAPFGGPIAMMHAPRLTGSGGRDRGDKGEKDRGGEKILICTSAGYQLAKIAWEGEGELVGMGWSDQEHLLTVADNGAVKVFDLHGKQVTQFSLLEPGEPAAHLLEVHFWGNGVAAISSESKVYVAEGLTVADLGSQGPRTYSLRTGLGRDRSYTSMAIVPPRLTRSGKLEVLLGTSDNSVVVVHEGRGGGGGGGSSAGGGGAGGGGGGGGSGVQNIIEDQLLQHKIDAPIVKMAVAPNGRFLACYRSDGILTVMSQAFTTKVLDFDAKSVSGPIEIAWCGEDAVVMQWRNTGIVMVGPFGDWLNFPYDCAVHLIAEPDCLRIVTATGLEVLQRIPAQTVAIRSVGSTDPSALMFDAMEAFEEGDPKSDENIRSIASSGQLAEAVRACIAAAAGEFDIPQQQSFLKAASYGKAFCPDADPKEFVDTGRVLRVLNEIRKPLIGIPLTVLQYVRLTPEVLVARLTTRNHHFLALKVCELLKLRKERVLIHWACAKVRKMAPTKATDDEIDLLIKTQLRAYGRVSFLAIAEAAYRVGRRRLATLVLDPEPHASQIPLLLQMSEEELALQKAIASEDTDLIYYTLIQLEERIVQARGNSVDYFYRIIHSHPEAANLLRLYQTQKTTPEDRAKLHQLLMYSKNFQEAGVAAANQAFLQRSAATKVQLLREASNLFSMGKDSFFKVMTDEEIDLMEVQRNLEMKFQTKVINLTLVETIEQLVFLSMHTSSNDGGTGGGMGAGGAGALYGTGGTGVGGTGGGTGAGGAGERVAGDPQVEAEIYKIVKKFRFAEKALWYVKIRCYSQRGQWGLLLRLANEKKSPVGYRPFARACMEHEQPLSEIEAYVDRITALEDRYALLMELRSFRKAADVASKLRDPQKLNEVGRTCKDQALERHIQDVLQKL